MKRLFLTIVGMCILGCGNAGAADNGGLIVDLASDHVDVSVGFSGASIEVFGDRRDKNTQVAIVVLGPERRVSVWEKTRIMGAWVNYNYAEFHGIPMYYNYALSDGGIIEKYPELAQENRIGVMSVFQDSSTEISGGVEDIMAYKTALVEQKRKVDIFPETHTEIKFLNDNFFRASFALPPSVPTGEYTIRSYLMKNGKIVHSDTEMLKIQQTGLNAYVLKAANKNEFPYALFCIALAAASGWLVSVLRVRI